MTGQLVLTLQAEGAQSRVDAPAGAGGAKGGARAQRPVERADAPVAPILCEGCGRWRLDSAVRCGWCGKRAHPRVVAGVLHAGGDRGGDGGREVGDN